MTEPEKKEPSPKPLVNFKLSGQGRIVPPKITDQTDVVLESESSPTGLDEKSSVG